MITELLARLWPGRVPELLAIDADRGLAADGAAAGSVRRGRAGPRPGRPDRPDDRGHPARLRWRTWPQLRASRGSRSADSPRTWSALQTIAVGRVPSCGFLDADERVAAARAALPGVERRLAELAAFDVPETLVHGDLHLGNVAHADDRLRIFDWTDACLAHPFVDLPTLDAASPDDERPGLREAYLDPWREQLSLPDTDRVMSLASVAERAFQAVTYERLQAAQEDASRWAMEGVVARCLRRLAEVESG